MTCAHETCPYQVEARLSRLQAAENQSKLRHCKSCIPLTVGSDSAMRIVRNATTVLVVRSIVASRSSLIVSQLQHLECQSSATPTPYLGSWQEPYNHRQRQRQSDWQSTLLLDHQAVLSGCLTCDFSTTIPAGWPISLSRTASSRRSLLP